MTPLMFIYKAVRKLWRVLLRNPFCHAATLVVMRGNGVCHGSFSTNGIPIVAVDRKNSKISIGDNLRMNNGNADNNIGFTARYTMVAIVEHDLKLPRSTYEVLRILSALLLDKTPIKELFYQGNRICHRGCPIDS